MKTCNKCKKDKHISEFYICSFTKDKFQYACIVCQREHAKRWRLNNLEKSNKHTKDYARRHREVRQKWFQENKEKVNKYMVEWRKKNNFVSKSDRNHNVKYHIIPKWANRFFIKEIYSLARLRTKITGFVWEVDHIHPLNGKTVCGLHVENNLQVIPRFDNRSKRNNMPKEIYHVRIF